MNWEDFLTFRRMITPYLIQVLFWIGVALSVLVGCAILFGGVAGIGGVGRRDGAGSVLGALCLSPLVVILGILVSRIYAELLIVTFRISETLTDIRELLERQRQTGA
ncbi:hypothetical protein HRbin22_00698 [Candidatus Thermoflexus japonica]|uniref:DUF4282 domain-containing protein n=1 Tax=Candidatus Thermoflexus japonica TaxID=2035417 RepID=A0A2H5Y556_9CHLR|nr:hypothetical protein HRbin22_00698 [Candidatus Thermoflexus japonica]